MLDYTPFLLRLAGRNQTQVFCKKKRRITHLSKLVRMQSKTKLLFTGYLSEWQTLTLKTQIFFDQDNINLPTEKIGVIFENYNFIQLGV